MDTATQWKLKMYYEVTMPRGNYAQCPDCNVIQPAIFHDGAFMGVGDKYGFNVYADCPICTDKRKLVL